MIRLRRQLIFLMTVAMITLTMGVAYAAISENLVINGTVALTYKRLIMSRSSSLNGNAPPVAGEVDQVVVTETLSKGNAPSSGSMIIDYDGQIAEIEVVFNNPEAEISFPFWVVNVGNVDAYPDFAFIDGGIHNYLDQNLIAAFSGIDLTVDISEVYGEDTCTLTIKQSDPDDPLFVSGTAHSFIVKLIY